MRVAKGKAGSKSKLVPLEPQNVRRSVTSEEEQRDEADLVDGEDDETIIAGVDGPERDQESGTIPSESHCGGCKYPNYGLNTFIPRLEVRHFRIFGWCIL
jgi:hypothetical protein